MLNLRDYYRPWRIIQRTNNSREVNRPSNLSSVIKVNRQSLMGVIRAKYHEQDKGMAGNIAVNATYVCNILHFESLSEKPIVLL